MAVQCNGNSIEKMTDEERTPEVCLAAVQQFAYVIKHLTDKQRTPELICKEEFICE
jgi:hypothetical protein